MPGFDVASCRVSTAPLRCADISYSFTLCRSERNYFDKIIAKHHFCCFQSPHYEGGVSDILGLFQWFFISNTAQLLIWNLLSLINIYVLMFGHIKVWQRYDKPEVKISRIITNGLCKSKINRISAFSRKSGDFVSENAFWPSRWVCWEPAGFFISLQRVTSLFSIRSPGACFKIEP